MNWIRQRDSMDCGPSCLAMIIKHYGQRPDIDILRRVCSLGKSGVSLLGISKTAEFIGFKSIGGRLSFDSLIKEAPLPCIAHWDQNHFVVVHKIKKLRNGGYTVYVADPAKGIITYNRDEFCTHWISTGANSEEKGIVLLLEPTEDFYSPKTIEKKLSNSRFSFLWAYTKKI